MNRIESSNREETNTARVELNTPAPDFRLADLNGKDVALSDYAGRKNVLIVFNRGFL